MANDWYLRFDDDDMIMHKYILANLRLFSITVRMHMI